MIQYDMHYGGTFSPQVRTEKTNNTGLEYLPYKFTAKELDAETSLYYYGARYLDPKYSMWLSTDPALGEYIPAVGKATTDEASKLPGMGGLFNHVNHNLYHYCGNNPVRYTDPTGMYDEDAEFVPYVPLMGQKLQPVKNNIADFFHVYLSVIAIN